MKSQSLVKGGAAIGSAVALLVDYSTFCTSTALAATASCTPRALSWCRGQPGDERLSRHRCLGPVLHGDHDGDLQGLTPGQGYRGSTPMMDTTAEAGDALPTRGASESRIP